MIKREEVAKIAGVSVTTVTRVANGAEYVSEKTREKVQKVIDQYHYKPNSVALNLTKKESKTIAVLVEDLCNQYVAEVVEVLTSEAMKFGFITMLFFVSEKNICAVIDDVLENNVAGLINLSLINIEQACGEKFEGRNINTVNVLEGKGLCLKMDYDEAMDLAFDMLAKAGKKHAVFIGGMIRSWMLGDGRVRSFLEKSRKLAEPSVENDVLSGGYPQKKYENIGYDFIMQHLAKGNTFDAVFCLNDAIAIGVMKALAEAGKKVPDEIAVVGCDNVRLARMLSPALTTFDGKIEEVADEYFKYAAGLATETFKTVRCNLIVRDSLK